MNNKRRAQKAQDIGYYYFYKGNYKKAIFNLLRAIAFKNTRPYFSETVFHDIAYCYENLGDFENALNFINKSLELSSGYLNGKIFLGNLYVNMGENKKGEEILKNCREEEERIKNTKLDLDAFYNKK